MDFKMRVCGIFFAILIYSWLSFGQSVGPNMPPFTKTDATPALLANPSQSTPIPSSPNKQLSQTSSENLKSNPATIKNSNISKNLLNNLTPDNYIKLLEIIIGIITAIVLALWAIYKWRHRKDNNGTPIIITNNGPNPDAMLDKFIEEARKNGKLEGEIDRLKTDLANAVNRVKELEKSGKSADAVAALNEIRKSGDAAKLQTVLIADRDLHKNALIKRNREISAVAYLRGDIDIALTAIEEILKLRSDDLDALIRKGIIFQMRGNLLEAIQCYKNVIGLAQVQNYEEMQAIASGNLGIVYQIRGEIDEAINSYNQSLVLNKKLGRQEGMANNYGNLGNIYQIRGNYEKALEMYNNSFAINQKLGRQEGLANNYGNLGSIYQTLDKNDKAVEMYNRSLEINEKLGRKEGMAIVYGCLGTVYGTRGEFDKALEMIKKALVIDEKLGRQEGMANQYGNLGIIYQTRGELDKAVEMHNKSLRIEEKIGKPEGIAKQYINLGIVYKTRGDKSKAREYYLKALEIFLKIGIPNMIKKVEGLLKKLDENK